MPKKKRTARPRGPKGRFIKSSPAPAEPARVLRRIHGRLTTRVEA